MQLRGHLERDNNDNDTSWRSDRPWPERVVLPHVVTDERGRPQLFGVVELIGDDVIAKTLAPASDNRAELAELKARCANEEPGVAGPGLAELVVLSEPKYGRRLENLTYKGRQPMVGADLPRFLSRVCHSEILRRPSGMKNGARRREHDLRLTLPGCAVWREDDKGRRRLKTSFYKAPILLDASAAGQAGAFIHYQQPVHPKDRRFAGRYPDGSRRPWLGEFADLLPITGALCGAEVATAAEMAGMLGIRWPDANPDPVTRLRAELAALVQCYRRIRAMSAELGVRPDRLRSTGSLASAALEAARVVPLAVKASGLSLIVKGACAGTFQGGTVMALDTHTLRHAALGDRSGDFPRVFSAGGWQEFLTCERIEAHPRDPTELATLLADAYLPDRLRTDRSLFRRLSRTVVLAHPAGEIAPVKVEGRPGEYSLHVGPLHYEGDVPLLGLDLAVAALAGPVPKIVAVWELVPVGRQRGLQPLPLPTGRRVNLLIEDLGQVLVEERERLKHDATVAPHERQRLLGLVKLFSNALVFGIFAREDREHLAHPVEVIAYDHHAKPHTIITDRPPRPGPWCWLPLASAIEAGSRLVTALTMYDIENAGLRCLHVCVDAVLVETPDQQAREVLADIFAGLDPLLAPTGPPAWKQEADSLSEPTLAYVAGTNKVVLLRPDREGRLRVVRSTDTGLGGHIADPVYSEELLPDGHHRWTAEYLAPVVEAAENFSTQKGWPVPVLPAEAQRPVVRRLRATTPAQLRRLRRAFPNDKERPWDFYLRADSESGPVYALGDGHDPAQWMALDWRRATGQPATLTVSDFYRPAGSVRVRSVADYIDDWHLGAGDELSEPIEDQGTWPWPERGPRRLMPAYSTPALTDLVSREGERLSLRDVDPDADIGEAQLTYGPLMEPTELVDQARRLGPTEAARRTQVSRATLDGLLYKGRTPSAVTVTRIATNLSDREERRRLCAYEGCRHRVDRGRSWCETHRRFSGVNRRLHRRVEQWSDL